MEKSFNTCVCMSFSSIQWSKLASKIDFLVIRSANNREREKTEININKDLTSIELRNELLSRRLLFLDEIDKSVLYNEREFHIGNEDRWSSNGLSNNLHTFIDCWNSLDYLYISHSNLYPKKLGFNHDTSSS